MGRYGLSSSEWQGRAAELNVQRIDLRDWLCTVVIENRRAIAEASGADLSTALTAALGFWDRGSVPCLTPTFRMLNLSYKHETPLRT